MGIEGHGVGVGVIYGCSFRQGGGFFVLVY